MCEDRRDRAGRRRSVRRERHPRAADIIGTGALEPVDEVGHVVRRVMGVGVHAHDDRAPRPGDAEVQSVGRRAFRVVEHLNHRIAMSVVRQHGACPIVAHAVDHQHLEPIPWVVGRQDRVQEPPDVFGFIAARHHNRDEGPRWDCDSCRP